MKEITVKCPCCEARLLVDVRTSTVLRHDLPAELDEFGKPTKNAQRWDAAVQKATKRHGDAFDAALEKEQGRSRDLDDLFDRARSKIERRKTDLDGE